MKNHIDYALIEASYGCDNCKHKNAGYYGYWGDFCMHCNPDYSPPSKYRPERGTIQEKLYYGRKETIKIHDYLSFLDNGK